jgi:MFS family permease
VSVQAIARSNTPIGVLTKERAVAPIGFNRWFVPPAALAVHLCIGQAYALSVFYGPLSHLIGGRNPAPDDWTPVELGWIFSLAIIVLGLSAALAARWQNRAGPRAVMFVAACCFGSGFLISALGVKVHLLWLLFLGYGVVGGIGLGLGYVSPISTLIQWFPDRKGLATGLAITGFGAGAMIGAPLSTALIDMFRTAASPGVAEALVAMGIIYFAVMSLGAYAIRIPSPEDELRLHGPAAENSVTLEAATRKPQFYLLWVVLAVNVMAGIGVLGQAPEMLSENLGALANPQTIVGFVGLLSLFNMAGRIVFASASDHLGRRNTYTILLIAGATLYASAPYMGTQLNAAFFVLLYALMIGIYGGGFATLPSYIADCFGPKFVEGIHGRLLTAWSAGVLGSVALNALREHEIAGGMPRPTAYAMNFEIIASLFLIALVCNWLVKPVETADVESSPAPIYRAAHRLHRPAIGFVLWVLVVLAVGWGIVTTIGRASELELSWKLLLTLLPLPLGVLVTVGFFYLDKTRYAVTGVSPSYIMAVALLFGLFASLMATDVWEKSARTASLNQVEISALESAVGIAEGLHPSDRTVRAAVNDELSTIGTGVNGATGSVSGKPLQALYEIAGDNAFFAGDSAANAAFYRAVDNIHEAHAERMALKQTRLAPAKLFSLVLFGYLTQLVIAISHTGKGRAVAVMIFSIAFSASIAVLELMDESVDIGQSSVAITLMAPATGTAISALRQK